MFKKFVLAVVLVSSIAASKAPKINTQALMTAYMAQSAGLTGDMAPATGSKHLEDFVRLVGVAHIHGVAVTASGLLSQDGLWGFYSERDHVIVLNDVLETDGAVAVLAHELGHVFTIPLLDGKEGDVVAQGISYIVCTRIGVDTAAPTFGYYNDLKPKLEIISDLSHNAAKIDAAAELMLKEMAEVKLVKASK